MSDSSSDDTRHPQLDDDTAQRDVTPTQGFVHEDLGDPERGLGPTEASVGGEPG